jgi:hypothetical protein
VLFEAGRAAARAGWWAQLGRLASVCLALVAIGLGGLLVRERRDRHALETLLAARPQSPTPTTDGLVAPPGPALAADSYFVLTHQMTAGGAEEPSISSGQGPGHHPGVLEPPLSPLGAWRSDGVLGL